MRRRSKEVGGSVGEEERVEAKQSSAQQFIVRKRDGGVIYGARFATAAALPVANEKRLFSCAFPGLVDPPGPPRPPRGPRP